MDMLIAYVDLHPEAEVEIIILHKDSYVTVQLRTLHLLQSP